MDYTIHQQLHGFEITNIRPIDGIKATMIELKHIKTQGEMIFLQREDRNMTFSVTMKTLPSDDTGVFHILEHSLLGGSEKYPVKEPFVELLKSSMNTFLNAMTFPDKTMYPVSSQTKKDFLNLVEVYLDAVFAPRIYTKKDIFLQEGWHYELLNQEDLPVYKGVVFNEMKGAYGNVDSYIENGLNKLLFADNCYQYESGGYPANIPDLTYESFLQQHHQYYSMSNARFFLDGNAPLDEVLALIEEYASKEEYIEVDATIPMQEEKAGLFNTIEYPIDENEDDANKTMIAFGKIACSYDEIEKVFAYRILTDYLASSNDSPIKKAILEKGLAQDIQLDLYDGIQQPVLILVARNTSPDKLAEIKQTIIQALKDELKNGLDHKNIESTLSLMEFKSKELGGGSSTVGISLNINILNSWLYGGDPALYLEVNDTFKELRHKLVQGYFESLIQEFLDHIETTATLVVNPSKTLSKELDEVEKAKLAKKASTWDEQTKQALIQENEHLLAWQQSVDTKEQLDTMPQLKLSDLDLDVETYPYTKTYYKDVPVLKYQLNTNGITYLHLYFSMKNVSQEELPYLGLYFSLLTELPTYSHSLTDLQTAMKSKFGAFVVTQNTFDIQGKVDECLPYISVKCSFLDENASDAYALIHEILFETIFDKKKVKEIVAQSDFYLQQSVMSSGHTIGLKAIAAAYSTKGVIAELSRGYSYIQFIKQLNENFDEQFSKLEEQLVIISRLYTTGNLTVSYNGEADVKEMIDYLIETDRHNEAVSYTFLPKENKEIKVPTQVSYATLGGNLTSLGGFNYSKMRVLAKIISLEYLWNEVRVKGGAYGCGLQISPSNDVFYYSYRDPNGKKTFDVYKNTKAFIEEYCKTKEDVDKFIISSISDEARIAVTAKLATGERHYFEKITKEQLINERKEILDTKITDLITLVEQLQKVINEDHTCIVGHFE